MKYGLTIALRGADGSGKSHVLRTVFNQLSENGWKSIVDRTKDGKEKTVSSRLEIRGAILKRDTSGEQIGFTTVGDTPGNLDNFLISRLELECEVYVCAARPTVGIVRKVNDLESQGYKVRWIEQRRQNPLARSIVLCVTRFTPIMTVQIRNGLMKSSG